MRNYRKKFKRFKKTKRTSYRRKFKRFSRARKNARVFKKKVQKVIQNNSETKWLEIENKVVVA